MLLSLLLLLPQRLLVVVVVLLLQLRLLLLLLVGGKPVAGELVEDGLAAGELVAGCCFCGYFCRSC